MLELSFFIFIAFISPFFDLFFYPRLRRSRYYLISSAWLWLLAGCCIALAIRRQHPWSNLRLDVPSPIRFAAGFAIVVAYVALAMKQRRALLAKPERLQKLMQRQPELEPLLPHTPSEARTFALLSVSAGVCEEIVYRGFIMWFATLWIGLWLGLLASTLIFGLAHAFLGRKHVIRTALVGLLFGFIAVGSATLWPAIVLHAFVDLLSGDLGYRALRG